MRVSVPPDMAIKFKHECQLELTFIAISYWINGRPPIPSEIVLANLTHTICSMIKFDYRVTPVIGRYRWRHWDYYPETEVFEYAPWQYRLASAQKSNASITAAEKVLALELLGTVI